MYPQKVALSSNRVADCRHLLGTEGSIHNGEEGNLREEW